MLLKLVFISCCYHESHRGELFLKHNVQIFRFRLFVKNLMRLQIVLISKHGPVTVSIVRQTTMEQMSSQADTNLLIAATVHGKGLKSSQPSSTPSSSQPPPMPDQRMALSSGPPGNISVASFVLHNNSVTIPVISNEHSLSNASL